MAIREGIRRTRVVGKAVLVFGLLFDAFLIVGVILAVGFNLRESYFAVGFAGIPLTLVGIGILMLAWIAEGFSLQRRTRSSGEPPQPDDPVQ
jgi:hypothetical protein